MNNRGLFITLEGGEGAGKTSLLVLLKEWFEKKGQKTLFTREPGGTFLGDEIRKLVLEKSEFAISSRAETLLFLASRAQHIEQKIKPALDQGLVVVCDRFSDSTIAYQGYARGLGVDEISNLSLFSTDGVQPDLTLYLDINPEKGLQRAKGAFYKQEFNDRIEGEKLGFHEKVREGFNRLAKQFPERIHVINAELSLDEVFAKAVELIALKM